VAGRLIRGEVRAYRFAPPDKERPVLLLTRDSMLDELNHVTIAPVTSTVRGVRSEVVLDVEDGMKGRCAVNLHLVQSVHRRGVGRHLATLGPARLREVCQALAYALGCYPVD
jgi:mRNA interferase MazF